MPLRGPPRQPLGQFVMIERVEGTHGDLNRDQGPQHGRRHLLDLSKDCHLAEEQAEPRMHDLQREAEAAVAELGVNDRERTGREPARQWDAAAEDLKEIARAAKDQRLVLDVDGQRHADAVADIFFEPGHAGEAFRRVDHLRETIAHVEARPDLPAGGDVLRHGHDARTVLAAVGWQRCADEAGGLDEAPAGPAHPGFQHLADIDGGVAAAQALAEAAANRRRQGGPVLLGQQCAEAKIAKGRWQGRRRSIDKLSMGDAKMLHSRLRFGRTHLRLPSGRKFTMRVPRRISAAICGRGTFSICAYQ